MDSRAKGRKRAAKKKKEKHGKMKLRSLGRQLRLIRASFAAALYCAAACKPLEFTQELADIADRHICSVIVRRQNNI
jgi:hypothetical protein